MNLIKTKTFLRELFLLFLLNTEKRRITIIIFVVFFLNITPREYLRYFPIPSLYDISGLYDYLGFEFYSAYISRSLYEILHFNLYEAYILNPLGYIFFIVILYIFIKDLISLYKKYKLSK